MPMPIQSIRIAYVWIE